MPVTRSNVIYVLSDEHRGQAMSHMGDPNVQTPIMDRLAREGISFSRAYANCPICTPSRGTLFSGRHAHCGPVSGFFDVFKATAPSTATALRDAGYHTTYIGKWHCGVVRDQVPRAVRENREVYPGGTRNRTPEFYRGGFQDWFGFECLNQPFTSSIYEGDAEEPTLLDGYQTDALTDWAIEYLQDYAREEPLFMVLSVEPPHFPLQVPERWQRFDPQELQVRPNFVERPSLPGSLPTPTPWTFSEQDVDPRRYLALYYAMIENLDFMDWRGLVSQSWKYAYYETGVELLYDLEADPYEMSNLAPGAPDLCAQMRQRLLAVLHETREPFFDVLIEHGVPCPPHVINVADDEYRILGAAQSGKDVDD